MGNTVQDAESLVEYANGRRIYPEVAEYFRARREAERTYVRATTQADMTYNSEYQELRWAAEDAGRAFDTYGNSEDRVKSRELERARNTAYDEAASLKTQQLAAVKDGLVNSPHREVAWIAENCLFAGQGGEIEGYARNILAILPASMEEIWEEAKDNRGMCEVFDRFYEQAEQAGVFSNGKVIPGYREMAAARSYIRREYGHGYARQLDIHLQRIAKAVNEHHEAELAKAKAEWQKQDEAYAENTHRNRSEASRRVILTRERAEDGRLLSRTTEGVTAQVTTAS